MGNKGDSLDNPLRERPPAARNDPCLIDKYGAYGDKAIEQWTSCKRPQPQPWLAAWLQDRRFDIRLDTRLVPGSEGKLLTSFIRVDQKHDARFQQHRFYKSLRTNEEGF